MLLILLGGGLVLVERIGLARIEYGLSCRA